MEFAILILGERVQNLGNLIEEGAEPLHDTHQDDRRIMIILLTSFAKVQSEKSLWVLYKSFLETVMNLINNELHIPVHKQKIFANIKMSQNQMIIINESCF